MLSLAAPDRLSDVSPIFFSTIPKLSINSNWKQEPRQDNPNEMSDAIDEELYQYLRASTSNYHINFELFATEVPVLFVQSLD